jgi:IclR family pca regulon transcriptional regulator
MASLQTGGLILDVRELLCVLRTNNLNFERKFAWANGQHGQAKLRGKQPIMMDIRIDETKPKGDVPGRSFVTAIERGLSVMRAFQNQSDRMTLSDVARLVELPRATTRRCLLTLRALGYVESHGRYFSLSPQVLTLAQAYLSSSPLPRIAQSSLERVSERLGESCSLSLLHGDEAIYIARSTRKRIGSLHRDVGSHLPAHCTSMGRVLLAALSDADLDTYFATARLESFTPRTLTDQNELRARFDKIRARGYCIVDQELEPDLRSIAIPVLNASGRTIAALNVSAQASRTTKKHLTENYLPVLREAARDMRPLLVG